MEEKFVKVRISYKMRDTSFRSGESSFSVHIIKSVFAEIQQQLTQTGRINNLEINDMLNSLIKLQGFGYLKEWNIDKEQPDEKQTVGY